MGHLITEHQLLEILKDLKFELQQAKRPAEEIVMDDFDLCKFLSISKRTAAEYRSQKLIEYSKIGGRIFYKLSDILTMIERHKIVTSDDRIPSSSKLKRK